MTRTIPIWACVLNRAIANHLQKMELNVSHDVSDSGNVSLQWDCSLYLPLWVSESEKAAIHRRLEEWTEQLEATGVDIGSLALTLRKPLRPLWISQKTVIWLNEVPDYDSWDFTPIILVSASSSSGVIQRMTTSEFSWHYIPGAGDDEESWARGLSPPLFWKHAYDLINSGPDLCNQRVANIVEKDRVCRCQRGQDAPQITIKPNKFLPDNGVVFTGESNDGSQLINLYHSNNHMSEGSMGKQYSIFWLASTNLAVGTTLDAVNVCQEVDCILNCDREFAVSFSRSNAYLHLPIVTSKLDRFSLLNNLSSALNFAKLNLSRGNRLLIFCSNGEDISVCVCLAILISLYDNEGSFDNGKFFKDIFITKWEMRRRLLFICNFVTNARPSRGNLKQVFNFLNRDKMPSIC